MRFFVPGDPVGKQRPRVANGHAYTPSKTKDYENTVALFCKNAMHKDGYKRVEHGPVEVEIIIWYRVPKSVSKAKQTAMLHGDMMPLNRPDIDNVVKAVLDAINGIAYRDDAQVVKLSASKAYAENPGVFVGVFGGD